MTARRARQPAGQQGRRRVAGAPDEQRRPAGVPEQPPAAESPAEEPVRAEQEAADAVEHDLDSLLADTRRERDEYLELARRTRADFENYRKRMGRETDAARGRGKSELARELIPALDNLERALRAAGVEPSAGDAATAADPPSEEASARDALAHGVALVLRELAATLERAGVESYDPTGEPFDPAWHEALSTRAEEGAASGQVIETIERGYRLDGQVLRAAKVVVSE